MESFTGKSHKNSHQIKRNLSIKQTNQQVKANKQTKQKPKQTNKPNKNPNKPHKTPTKPNKQKKKNPKNQTKQQKIPKRQQANNNSINKWTLEIRCKLMISGIIRMWEHFVLPEKHHCINDRTCAWTDPYSQYFVVSWCRRNILYWSSLRAQDLQHLRRQRNFSLELDTNAMHRADLRTEIPFNSQQTPHGHKKNQIISCRAKATLNTTTKHLRFQSSCRQQGEDKSQEEKNPQNCNRNTFWYNSEL